MLLFISWSYYFLLLFTFLVVSNVIIHVYFTKKEKLNNESNELKYFEVDSKYDNSFDELIDNENALSDYEMALTNFIEEQGGEIKEDEKNNIEILNQLNKEEGEDPDEEWIKEKFNDLMFFLDGDNSSKTINTGSVKEEPVYLEENDINGLVEGKPISQKGQKKPYFRMDDIN